MRSAGCAINDFADRHIDLHVTRTRNRPLAQRTIQPWEAVMVFTVLSLIAFALVLLMNRLTVQLALVAVALAALYPFSKRYTYMPQVVLGAAFGWSVPMAFAAQTGDIPVIAWLLYTATLLWTTAYDTMYAMVDRDDDIRIGVKSSAILFGEGDVPLVMFLQALALTALALAGRQLELGYFYYAGLGGALIVVVYQYFLIRHRDRNQCFRAFLSNHYLGMLVFVGLFAHYLWRMFGPPAA
jgi:4-hydroxybenzoate polyprenyltransferase